MKSNLILSKFNTENVIGTFSTKDVKNFFGSKLTEIEDEININELSIQYSELSKDNASNDDLNKYGDGHQFYLYNNREKIFLKSLTQLKLNNHSILLDNQSEYDLNNNTRWILNINIKEILKNYIFYKIKESRTFKCIRYTDLINLNINLSILDYIEKNILDRYYLKDIKLYIDYINIKEKQDVLLTNSLVKFQPLFDIDSISDNNLVSNLNVEQKNKVLTNDVKINYKQIKSSQIYKFNYYFNLIFEKI